MEKPIAPKKRDNLKEVVAENNVFKEMTKIGIMQPFFAVKVPSKVRYCLEDSYRNLVESASVLVVPKDHIKNNNLEDLSLVWFHGRSHKRSVLLPTYKNCGYKYLDIKGIGHVQESRSSDEEYKKRVYTSPKVIVTDPSINTKENRDFDVYGLEDSVSALEELRMHKKIQSMGVKTWEILGINSLDFVIVNGKEVSVTECKANGALPEHFDPVTIVRGQNSLFRMRDLRDQDGVMSLKQKMTLFEFAIVDAFPELEQWSGSERVQRYFEIVTEVMAKNLGILTANRIAHGNLRPLHNIGMDGSFIDFDMSTEDPTDQQLENQFGALLTVHGNTKDKNGNPKKTSCIFYDQFMLPFCDLYGVQDTEKILENARRIYEETKNTQYSIP